MVRLIMSKAGSGRNEKPEVKVDGRAPSSARPKLRGADLIIFGDSRPEEKQPELKAEPEKPVEPDKSHEKAVEKPQDKAPKAVKSLKDKLKPLFSKKNIIIASIIISIILLAAIGFIIYFKLNVTVGDELNLVVTPLEQIKEASSGQSAEFSFTIMNDNFLQCSAECTFKLMDQRNSEPAYQSTEVLGHGQKIEKSFEVKAPTKGEGQVYLTFRAECRNIKSVFCLTDSEPRVRTASGLLMYHLSDFERTARDDLKPKVERLLSESEVLDFNLKNFPVKSIPFGPTEAGAIRSLFSNLSAESLNTQLKVQKLGGLWELEEYGTMKSLYWDSDLQVIKGFRERAKSLYQSARDLQALRNSNIELISRMEPLGHDINSMVGFYNLEPSPANEKALSSFSSGASQLFDGYLQITRNATHSSETLRNSLSVSVSGIQSAVNDYKLARGELLFRVLYSQALLELKNGSAAATLDCSGLRKTLKAIDSVNNESEQEYAPLNGSLDNERLDASRYLARLALERSRQALSNSTSDFATEALEFAGLFQVEPYEQVPTSELIGYALVNTSASRDFLGQACAPEETSGMPKAAGRKSFENPLARIDYAALSGFRISANISYYDGYRNITLEDNPPQCCGLGQCRACCEGGDCRQESYPVILIHGHAFNSKNTPEYSLTTFTAFQEKLQEDGFIPLGQLDLKAQSGYGVWGRSQDPVVYKASYYYITHYDVGDYAVSVRNDEGIENYAIRLKEIIELAMQKTGKGKVVLVAHSMGGLVAREYVDLFGSQNVDKLITVNTPNHGVIGRTSEWCTLFGSARECSELSGNSILLSRLNAKPLPKGLPVYSVRSTGCRMENGNEGDGVVTNESAYLEGAENYEIKGKCTDSLNSNLHNDALNPARYPEMYDTIVSILKK